MPADPLKRWSVGLCRATTDVGVRPLVAAVVDRIGTALDVGPVAAPDRLHGIRPTEPSLADGLFDGVADPPGGWANPWLAGVVHEQAATAVDRRARGAWYTPRAVVEGLVRVATAEAAADELTLIVDPTCGGGAFLLAALDRLVELGVDPQAAIERVVGMDVDPTAVEVTRWSLQLWLLQRLGRPGAAPGLGRIDVRCGNALVDLPESWLQCCALAVGNPPFATPLKAGTIEPSAAAFRQSRAELLGPYADLASIHLLRTIEGLPVGSTVALVQPQSILSSRDTRDLRTWLAKSAPLRALWASRESVFDAGVRACCPILRVGAPAGEDVRLYHGLTVEERGTRVSQRWGGLAADALGAPELPQLGGRRLGSIVTATAGFRDEHYALVAACREGSDDQRSAQPGSELGQVFTVGSVDPLSSDWGRHAFRFGGRSWIRPVVDRQDLPPGVQRWFDRLRCPKVLLATQAKLLEPFVDRHGTIVPATPLIAVTADPADLDRVAAVLLAPPVVLWAWRRWFGTAMSVDALKLAAKQVGELPLPLSGELWDEAATLIGQSDELAPAAAWDRSMEVARLMTSAYGADEQVFDWWLSRRKSRPVAE